MQVFSFRVVFRPFGSLCLLVTGALCAFRMVDGQWEAEHFSPRALSDAGGNSVTEHRHPKPSPLPGSFIILQILGTLSWKSGSVGLGVFGDLEERICDLH